MTALRIVGEVGERQDYDYKTGRDRGGTGRGYSGRALDAGHRRREPIAARGDGLDAAPFCSALVENPAECRDLHGQVGVLDDCPSPDGRHDLLFRNEITGPLDEHTENIEGSRADGDRNKNATLI